MKKYLAILTLFFSVFSFAQNNLVYDLIDKKIALIPQQSTTSTKEIANYIEANFKTDNEKIRAILYWTASNIIYEVANMFAIHFEQNTQGCLKQNVSTAFPSLYLSDNVKLFPSVKNRQYEYA